MSYTPRSFLRWLSNHVSGKRSVTFIPSFGKTILIEVAPNFLGYTWKVRVNKQVTDQGSTLEYKYAVQLANVSAGYRKLFVGTPQVEKINYRQKLANFLSHFC